MDPCHFVRITVGNLALKSPPSSAPTSNYFCSIRFKDFPHQTAALPLLPFNDHPSPPSSLHPLSACFSLSKSDLDRILDKSRRKRKHPNLKIHVYSGDGGGNKPEDYGSVNPRRGRKLLGRVAIPVDLTGHGDTTTRATVLCSGWVPIGKGRKKKDKAEDELMTRNNKNNSEMGSSPDDHHRQPPQLHATVKAEADPRFLFEFDGEPVCSPQVFQVQGTIRQPVFTCKFSFKNYSTSSSSPMSESSTSSSWLSTLLHRPLRRSGTGGVAAARGMRKGWSITIHDLSGSPVAAASIVAPFMPLPGSNRVSKYNPGAWLILRPGDGTWKPWGRLEAWRERTGIVDSLGYRFDLLPDTVVGGGTAGVMNLSNGAISANSGGKFSIDLSTCSSPISSPNGSFDLGSGTRSSSGSRSGFGSGSGSESGSAAGWWWWPQYLYRGFVMSSTVGGKKRKGGKAPPRVEVGAHHVTCTEDAAVFVALAAAMDLSMDACKLFSKKLRKELRPQGEQRLVA